MNSVRQIASLPARNSGNGAAEPNARGRCRVGGRSAASTPNGSRRVRATDAAKTTRRSARPARAQRATNALRVEEVLKAARPRGVRPADIRKALQKKRITISFPSLGGALRQLEARNAAKQVGKRRTWRY